MQDARVFWGNVFAVLAYQGRSIEYLAGRLGVSRAAIYRWRDGSRVAPAEQRHRAAELIGVPEPLLFVPRESPDGVILEPLGAEEAEAIA